MDEVVLTSQSPSGERLSATFFPDRGMNLLSYKLGNKEVIDQSTHHLFEERYAGLGSLIGPHFHRRHAGTIPPLKDESLFPHIANMHKEGVTDPFTHGVGRYAPWKSTATENKIEATLSGKDEWNGVTLSYLEGQNFKMSFKANLSPQGLHLRLSVVSDIDSVVGTHYYYALPQGRGKVISDVKNHYYDGNILKEIPRSWNYNSQHVLDYDLSEPADFAFHPFFDPLKGSILLDAESYKLKISYDCPCQENSWQLYHPAGASFVCIEPVSSQNPRRPNLTVSSINILLTILEA